MRSRDVVMGLFASVALAGCHLLLGLEEATVFCAGEDSVCACKTDADCAGEPPDCRVARCVDGICRLRNAEPGARCSTGFCSDTEGAMIYPVPVCVACVFDSHCEPGAYCAHNTCARCDNGIQDGDEAEPDCGGHCPQCQGMGCTSPEQCITGYCVDGKCCDHPCTDMCAYCGIGGVCDYLPQFADDDKPFCNGKMSCNGGGGCALNPGQACASEVQCASLKCQDGKCTGPEG